MAKECPSCGIEIPDEDERCAYCDYMQDRAFWEGEEDIWEKEIE